MLILFVPILAALGAAYALRGRQARGLAVTAVALATELLVFVANERWNWAAFTVAMLALCAIGIALARRET